MFFVVFVEWGFCVFVCVFCYLFVCFLLLLVCHLILLNSPQVVNMTKIWAVPGSSRIVSCFFLLFFLLIVVVVVLLILKFNFF